LGDSALLTTVVWGVLQFPQMLPQAWRLPDELCENHHSTELVGWGSYRHGAVL
jgi:hypothetical protein